MKPTEGIEAARIVALRYLAFSARSRSELKKRLERDEFEPDVIEMVLEEMEEAKYLDDDKFARDWVEDRADRKRYGKTRLAAELKGKGVPKEQIQDALEEVGEEDEVRRALQAAEGKWSEEKLRAMWSGNSPETVAKEKQRIAGFLQRRGFSWPIITKVLTALLKNKR